MFFRLFKYDLKNGTKGCLKTYLISFFVFLISFFYYLAKQTAYIAAGGSPLLRRSYGDALLFIFGGMREFNPSVDTQFIFPALWMLICVLAVVLTVYYPTRDYSDTGMNILIRSESRLLWWLSKYLWAAFAVALFYLLAYLALFLLCLITDVPLTMRLSSNVNVLFDMHGGGLLHPHDLAVETMLLPPLVLIACNYIQMTLSLFIRPVFAFIISISILLSSAYYRNMLLIGNYAMPVRNNLFLEGSIDTATGILLCMILITLSVIIGSAKFRKTDILKKGE